MPANFATAGDREAGVKCAHCGISVAAGDAVAVCAACGALHHRACWEREPVCGSYACAPGRRDLSAPGTPGTPGTPGFAGAKWTISPADLASARPLPKASRFPAGASVPVPMPAPRALPRLNRLAIAALIAALIGIPLPLVAGAAAILLASLAFGGIYRHQQKGVGLALAGLLLGLADLTGWIFFIVAVLNRGGGDGVSMADLRFTKPDLDNVPAHIDRAMRANVLITVSHGWSGRGIGSGIILKLEAGQATILTNHHVVGAAYRPDDASQPTDPTKLKIVKVDICGQDPVDGQVIWLAPDGIDLALVRAPCTSPDARATHWPCPDKLEVSKPVFAIGNPHALGWTYTQGAISQVRSSTAGHHDYAIIQTSAAINPGNSGGGLYDDATSALIGINTWTNDKRTSEGLGFAISFESFLRLAPPGFENGPSTRPATQPEAEEGT